MLAQRPELDTPLDHELLISLIVGEGRQVGGTRGSAVPPVPAPSGPGSASARRCRCAVGPVV